MKRAIAGFALVVAAMVPTGCTNTGAGARIAFTQPPAQINVETLKRNEYTILEAVEGKARFKYSEFLIIFRTKDPREPGQDETDVGRSAGAPPSPLAGIPLLGGLFAPKAGVHGSFITGEPPMDGWTKDQAEARALHDALSKVPGADTLIAPRFEWKWKVKDYLFGADYEAEVTCKGKAIQLKTGDLPYTPSGYWPPK